MRIGPNLDIKPDDVFAHKEIYKARSKEVHFRTLAEKTGIPLDEMVFYDNQMNNMNAVSRLPVTCIYTPDGVTRELFEKSLKVFPAPGKIIK
jgi:magnesium-dependent phosphatase 1